MILFPNIAYSIYSLIDFYSRESIDQIDLEVFKAPIVHFSMYWSAGFGFFTYYILKNPRPSTAIKTFMKYSILGCFMYALSFGFIYWRFKEKMVFFISAIINVSIPIIVSMIAYINAVLLKRQRRFSLLSMFQSNPSSIFWYSALPIICLAPDYIFDVIFLDIEYTECTIIIQFVTTILYHAWALMSLWAYWPMTKNNEEDIESLNISRRLNSTMETTRFL